MTDFPDAAAFFNIVLSHTIQGTFCDPFYGGNANFAGWDLIGYPGVRLAVTAGELAPPFLVASAAGIALGLGIAYLVEPGLDLSTLAAGGRDVAVRLDPLAPLLLLVALLLVSEAGIWATGAVIRRTSLGRSLRMGER